MEDYLEAESEAQIKSFLVEVLSKYSPNQGKSKEKAS